MKPPHRGVAIVAAAIAVAVLLTAALTIHRGAKSNGPPFVTFGAQPAVASTTAAALADGHWSSIPRPPMTEVDAAVWTGHEVLAIGNGARDLAYTHGAIRPAMAAYDPDTNRWGAVAPPPPGPWLVDHADLDGPGGAAVAHPQRRQRGGRR